MSGAPAKRRRLDSDDEDDDYAQPSRSSPLLHYAVTAALPTDEVPLLGLPDSEEGVGDARRDSTATQNGGTAAPEGTAAPSVGVSSIIASTSPAEGAAPVGPPLTFDDDDDVPSAYKGLFSTELLNVLLVPLDAICRQSTMTDKLLAQYLPQRVAQKTEENDGEGAAQQQQPGVYRNAFGIAPGFRWDGVVRGRGPVE